MGSHQCFHDMIIIATKEICFESLCNTGPESSGKNLVHVIIYMLIVNSGYLENVCELDQIIISYKAS